MLSILSRFYKIVRSTLMFKYKSQSRSFKSINCFSKLRYKFEDEDEEGTFTTKEDFFHSLEKDLDKGLTLPDEFKVQLSDYKITQK